MRSDKMRAWAEFGLPPVAWMALVLGFSSASFSAANTSTWIERLLRWCWPGLLAHLDVRHMELLNFAARKLAHLTEYGLLSALLFRAYIGLCGRSRRIGLALALSVAGAAALADETHQSLCAVRTGTWVDVLLDLGGAALGVAAFWTWERKRAGGQHRRP